MPKGRQVPIQACEGRANSTGKGGCSIRRVLARTARTAHSCTRTPVRLSRPRVMEGWKEKITVIQRRRPSKKRGKSAEKAAACCLSTTATLTGVSLPPSEARFALAARKGEANKRDHWVVDEHKGTCTRIHQKFRTCLYAPRPEHCPVPFWRLKGNVEARMYGSEGFS